MLLGLQPKIENKRRDEIKKKEKEKEAINLDRTSSPMPLPMLHIFGCVLEKSNLIQNPRQGSHF